VQFHWQRSREHTEIGAAFDEHSSCWIRVAYPSAGAAWGHQFIPRIGQEVVVDFLEGDIDRPLVTGVVYDGRQPPPWFSGAGQLPANKTLSGIRTKEHFGSQYNELLFDDTPEEVRTKLSSEHGKTQLNQGFLIHPRKDGQGEPRGEGFELRTDRHGAIRAAEGLLLSTEAQQFAQGKQIDRKLAQAQLDAARQLAQKLSETAAHQNADPLETGPRRRDEEGQEEETESEESLTGHLEHLTEAVHAWEDGTNTDVDHGDTNTDADSSASTSAKQQGRQGLLVGSSKAGIGMATPAEIVLASGHNLDTLSLRDLQQIAGRRWINVVGSKISQFVHGIKDKINFRLITAKGHAQFHAQSGDTEIVGDQNLRLYANKKILQAVAGEELLLACAGAYIRIKGGNIDIHAPGKLTIQASTVNRAGPDSLEVPPLVFPQINIDPFPFKLVLRLVDIPGPNATPLSGVPWKIVRPRVLVDFLAGIIDPDDVLVEGVSNEEGKITLTDEQEKLLGEHHFKSPGCLWIAYSGQFAQLNITPESPDWRDEEKLMHALAGLGYSDAPQQGRRLGTSPSDIKRAVAGHDLKNSAALLGQWKKED
jgi:type VI secretion system secreted protein VgrG